MGRILVFYHSNTDCTSQMGKLVAAGAAQIPGHEIRLRSTEDCTHADVLWADGLAVGTPTNLGGIAWRMKKWWDEFAADNWNKCDGKLCTVFSSQGGHGGGAEMSCLAMSTVLMNFGFLSFGVTDYVDKIHTLHYGAVVAKQPRNEHDRLACERLGLRLAEWVAVYVDGRKTLHPLLTTKADDAATAEKAKAEDAASAPAGAARAVHVVVTKEVPEANQAEWLGMAEKLAHHTWREPGVLKYNFVKSADSPTRFVITEEWASMAHLEAHFATPHFTTYVPKMDAISETVSIDKCVDALARRPAGSALVESLAVGAERKRTALVFNKATAYRHDSIDAATECMCRLLAERGWASVVSDDSSLLEKGTARPFDAIVFVNNSGDIFDPANEALSEHLAAGRGVLGVHAALACFLTGECAAGHTLMGTKTDVIRELYGAHFRNHPPPQQATLHVHHDAAAELSPAFAELPPSFSHHDEFFNFDVDPSAGADDVRVLVSVDEKTYEGGLHGERHPLVWSRALGERRAPVFYSALGHFAHDYDASVADTSRVQAVLRAGLDYVITQSAPVAPA